MMVKNTIAIENARLAFRNFSGAEGKFNPAGRRNFCIFLDYDIAVDMEKDGWNVRWLDPKEEGDESQPYIQVAVAFNNRPPAIYLYSTRGRTRIGEESVSILDWAEISNVDLVITPYNWESNGKSGVKAYLKSMHVTIQEDEFADKYRDVPDSASSAILG